MPPLRVLVLMRMRNIRILRTIRSLNVHMDWHPMRSLNVGYFTRCDELYHARASGGVCPGFLYHARELDASEKFLADTYNYIPYVSQAFFVGHLQYSSGGALGISTLTLTEHSVPEVNRYTAGGLVWSITTGFEVSLIPTVLCGM